MNSFVIFTVLTFAIAALTVNGGPISPNAANPSETSFRFRVKVSDIDSKCFRTPDFQLNSVFWTIELCGAVNGPFVTASLVSHFAEDAPRWTSKAEAVIRLIPQSGTSNEIIEKKTEKQSFDNQKVNQTFPDLVNWNDFIAKYASDGEAIFEIEISTEKPTRKFASEQFYTKSIVVFKNVNTIANDGYETEEFSLRGMKCKVRFEKTDLNMLAVLLHVNENDLLKNEVAEATMNVDLLKWNQNSQNFGKQVVPQLSKRKNVAGINDFILWPQFVNSNNDFVQNEMARFIIEIDMEVAVLE